MKQELWQHFLAPHTDNIQNPAKWLDYLLSVKLYS